MQSHIESSHIAQLWKWKHPVISTINLVCAILCGLFWFEREHSNEIGTTIEKFKNIGEKIGKYSKISKNIFENIGIYIRKYRKIFENIGKNRKLFEKIVCQLAHNKNSSKCLSQNSFVFIMKFLGLLVLVFGCAVAFPRAGPSCECGK